MFSFFKKGHFYVSALLACLPMVPSLAQTQKCSDYVDDATLRKGVGTEFNDLMCAVGKPTFPNHVMTTFETKGIGVKTQPDLEYTITSEISGYLGVEPRSDIDIKRMDETYRNYYLYTDNLNGQPPFSFGLPYKEYSGKSVCFSTSFYMKKEDCKSRFMSLLMENPLQRTFYDVSIYEDLTDKQIAHVDGYDAPTLEFSPYQMEQTNSLLRVDLKCRIEIPITGFHADTIYLQPRFELFPAHVAFDYIAINTPSVYTSAKTTCLGEEVTVFTIGFEDDAVYNWEQLVDGEWLPLTNKDGMANTSSMAYIIPHNVGVNTYRVSDKKQRNPIPENNYAEFDIIAIKCYNPEDCDVLLNCDNNSFTVKTADGEYEANLGEIIKTIGESHNTYATNLCTGENIIPNISLENGMQLPEKLPVGTYTIRWNFTDKHYCLQELTIQNEDTPYPELDVNCMDYLDMIYTPYMGDCMVEVQLDPIVANGYSVKAMMHDFELDYTQTQHLPIGENQIDWIYTADTSNTPLLTCVQTITVKNDWRQFVGCWRFNDVSFTSKEETVKPDEIIAFLQKDDFVATNYCTGETYKPIVTLNTESDLEIGDKAIATYTYFDLEEADSMVCFQTINIVADTTGSSTLTENLGSDTGHELVDVYNAMGVKVKSKVNRIDALEGLRNGVYLVGDEKVIVSE